MENKDKIKNEDNKPIEIDLGGVKPNQSIFTNEEIVTSLEKSNTINNQIKKAQSGSPVTKVIQPKTFNEQFYFQDDGKLWININNTWKSFTPNP